MSILLRIGVCLCFIYSCIGTSNKIIEHDIGSLALGTPSFIKFSTEKGLDSKVATLETGRATFHIEYGTRNVVNKLYEASPHVFNSKERDKMEVKAGSVIKSDEAVFSDYPEEDEEQRIFDENYYMYDTLNGIVAKIIRPKRIGKGITGVYIPALKDGNSFSMYGVNLDSSSHTLLLQIAMTIKYR